jgi:hypothetical protein
MTKPYLPRWATAQEASDWLETETGERWPIARLIESGVGMSVWLDCPADVAPEVLEHVFQGRVVGFRAEVISNDDTARLTSVTDSGTLSIFRRPDGEIVKPSAPIRFPATELQFNGEHLQENAAATRRGVPPAMADLTSTMVVPESVMDETPKKRRARLLEFQDAEIAAGRGYGSLAAITKMEKQTRPTADRANIGRDIKKARKERDATRRGGALIDQLR